MFYSVNFLGLQTQEDLKLRNSMLHVGRFHAVYGKIQEFGLTENHSDILLS